MDRVLDGFNVLLVSYGSSGTGKGHTFQGTTSEPGAILSSATHLFHTLATLPSTRSFLTISAYQIQHNSVVVDLLAPSTLSPLTVVDHRHHRATVQGVAQLPFASPEELSTLLHQSRGVHCALALRGGGTKAKPHVVVEWRVEVEREGVTRQSLVRFVQCAGSGGASLRFNPGLTALSSVVGGLAQGKDAWSVPFASSALTRLMEFGLAGQAHCLFFLCIDEREEAQQDTAHSLHLASQLTKIPLKPQSNRSRTGQQLTEIREEVAQVRGRLGLQMTGEWSEQVDPRDVVALRRLLEELDKVKGDTWPKRMKECDRWRQLRVERLQKEGLAHVLLDSIEVPQSTRDAADLLLRDIVQLTATADEVDEDIEQLAAEGAEGDDPRLKEAVDRQAELRAQLEGVEREHRKVVQSIVSLGAEQRRTSMDRSDTGVITYTRSLRSHQRRAMAADRSLASQLAALDESAALITQRFEGGGAVGGVVGDAVALTGEWLAVSKREALSAWERERLWGRLIEERVTGEVQRERQREEQQQLLKEYRAGVEEEKRAMESRYRALLDHAVRDALRWSEESAQLRRQLEDQHRRV